MTALRKSPQLRSARLTYFTIFSDKFKDDETADEEAIAYFFKEAASRTTDASTDTVRTVDALTKDELNWQLRQIGLAKGMVQFADELSDNQPVDFVETKKTRNVLREIEPGWWILICVTLAQVASNRMKSKNESSLAASSLAEIDYSDKEMSPPELVLKQFVEANRVFLLHQGHTLSELLARVGRGQCRFLLARYWDSFIDGWTPLMHGSPCADLFDGIQLAGGGELGFGMDNQHRGKEERDIIEGFLSRTHKVEDLIVGRYSALGQSSEDLTQSDPPYINDLSSALEQSHQDGIIFSGVGKLSRRSIQDICSWAKEIGRRGPVAYGISERSNTTSVQSAQSSLSDKSCSRDTLPAGTSSHAANHYPIKPRISGKVEHDLPPEAADTSNALAANMNETTESESPDIRQEVIKYLTLGIYGTSWGISAGRPISKLSKSDINTTKSHNIDGQYASEGYFLIGLLESLEERPVLDSLHNSLTGSSISHSMGISGRSLYIERQNTSPKPAQKDAVSNSGPVFDRVRVIVYAQPPFLFILLFQVDAEDLATKSLYRSIHHQLGPLHKALLASTDAEVRLGKPLASLHAQKDRQHDKMDLNGKINPIYSIIFNSARSTIHSTIPSIPSIRRGQDQTGLAMTDIESWTRLEAISIHSEIINVMLSTRRRPTERERTCKTTRGWWIVWMRLNDVGGEHTSDEATASKAEQDEACEAFLIRKASDYVAPKPHKDKGAVLGSFSFGLGSAGSGWVTSPGGRSGAARLAEGIGVDARQYVDSLLSLVR